MDGMWTTLQQLYKNFWIYIIRYIWLLIIIIFIRHKQSSEYKVLQTDLDTTDAY